MTALGTETEVIHATAWQRTGLHFSLCVSQLKDGRVFWKRKFHDSPMF